MYYRLCSSNYLTRLFLDYIDYLRSTSWWFWMRDVVNRKKIARWREDKICVLHFWEFQQILKQISNHSCYLSDSNIPHCVMSAWPPTDTKYKWTRGIHMSVTHSFEYCCTYDSTNSLSTKSKTFCNLCETCYDLDWHTAIPLQNIRFFSKSVVKILMEMISFDLLI